MKRLLRTSDLFVLPCVVAADGDQDGIPVALMEAMALGVPVISTPVSGIPELIQHDRNGLLAKPRDEGELADCICRLLDSVEERRRFALAARTTIETEFESSIAARGLLDNILKNR